MDTDTNTLSAYPNVRPARNAIIKNHVCRSDYIFPTIVFLFSFFQLIRSILFVVVLRHRLRVLFHFILMLNLQLNGPHFNYIQVKSKF